MPHQEIQRSANKPAESAPPESGRRTSNALSLTKRAMDTVLSGVGLIVLLPLLGILAGCVRATMGSPIFFRQQRPGLRGEIFGLLKFRSMRTPRRGEDGPDFDAQRITRLGKFMRATSLDELPTLWNVLKGDMSLVGPRPLLVRYLGRYTPEQARRHQVRPGITGWAQVHGRNSTSWEERFANDLFYVDHQTFLLDLKILFGTIAPVLGRTGIQNEGHGTMPEFMGTESSLPEPHLFKLARHPSPEQSVDDALHKRAVPPRRAA